MKKTFLLISLVCILNSLQLLLAQTIPATKNNVLQTNRYNKNVRSNSQRNDRPQANTGNTNLFKIEANGNRLKIFYLGLNVENLWIAGSHINWETGVADKPDATSGNHTHCSAFVAAACKRLNIYILRPPEHKQLLLANAQYEWLASGEAANSGWKPVTGNNVYEAAQVLANKGMLVIAVCKNPDESKPGHAALVMPTEITKEKLSEEGPVVIMAGTHNHNMISLKKGFKSHLANWPETSVQFYYNTSAPAEEQLNFIKIKN